MNIETKIQIHDEELQEELRQLEANRANMLERLAERDKSFWNGMDQAYDNFLQEIKEREDNE